MGEIHITPESWQLLNEKIGEIHAMVREQNGRVRKLEAWRNRLAGAWIMIAGVVGYLLKN